MDFDAVFTIRYKMNDTCGGINSTHLT